MAQMAFLERNSFSTLRFSKKTLKIILFTLLSMTTRQKLSNGVAKCADRIPIGPHCFVVSSFFKRLFLHHHLWPKSHTRWCPHFRADHHADQHQNRPFSWGVFSWLLTRNQWKKGLQKCCIIQFQSKYLFLSLESWIKSWCSSRCFFPCLVLQKSSWWFSVKLEPLRGWEVHRFYLGVGAPSKKKMAALFWRKMIDWL